MCPVTTLKIIMNNRIITKMDRKFYMCYIIDGQGMKKLPLQLQVQMFFFVKWNSWSLFTNKSKLFARCWRARWTIKDLDSVLEQPGWGWSMSFWDFLFLGLFTGLRGRGACFFQDKHKQTRKLSTHPNVNLFSFSDLWISKFLMASFTKLFIGQLCII